jgi:hypothetical protein
MFGVLEFGDVSQANEVLMVVGEHGDVPFTVTTPLLGLSFISTESRNFPFPMIPFSRSSGMWGEGAFFDALDNRHLHRRKVLIWLSGVFVSDNPPAWRTFHLFARFPFPDHAASFRWLVKSRRSCSPLAASWPA